MTFNEWLPKDGFGCASVDDIAKMAWNAAVKQEREACAKVCEDRMGTDQSNLRARRQSISHGDWRMKPYPLLCKDCKHSKPELYTGCHLRCHNPVVNGEDPWALASTEFGGSNCSAERSKKWFAKCGMKGKLWEAKE